MTQVICTILSSPGGAGPRVGPPQGNCGHCTEHTNDQYQDQDIRYLAPIAPVASIR